MKRLITLIVIAFISLTSFATTDNNGVDPAKKRLEKWNKSYVTYPAESSIQNEQGLVFVSFELNIDGDMKNVTVDSNLSESFNEKAVQIVNAMPKQHLYATGFFEGTVFVLPVKFKND